MYYEMTKIAISPVAARAVDCDGLSLSAGLARSAIPANTRPFKKTVHIKPINWPSNNLLEIN